MKNDYNVIGKMGKDIGARLKEDHSDVRRWNGNEWTGNEDIYDIIDVIENLSVKLNKIRGCVSSAKDDYHSNWNQSHREAPDKNYRGVRPWGGLGIQSGSYDPMTGRHTDVNNQDCHTCEGRYRGDRNMMNPWPCHNQSGFGTSWRNFNREEYRTRHRDWI